MTPSCNSMKNPSHQSPEKSPLGKKISKSFKEGLNKNRSIGHGFDPAMTFIVSAPEPKLQKSLTLEDFYVNLI